MSVHDAEPGDIYTDEQGKLWRIISICRDPTVCAEEVEGRLFDPNAPPHPQMDVSHMTSIQAMGIIARARIDKERKEGGIGGLMWKGWKRIWRNDWKAKQPADPVEIDGA